MFRGISITVATLLVVAGLAPADHIVADSINGSAGLSTATWSGGEVGWHYTPGFSYDLHGVETRFSGVDDRTVTVEVYDSHPGSGGVLLRSGDFIPSTEFEGGTFAPLSLVGGEEYFIGFRNVADLGVNVTDDAGAANLTSGLYFSFDNNGNYSEGPESHFTAQPMLQFLTHGEEIAPAPEPSTLLLASMGALGLSLGVVRRRRRQARG